MTFESRDERVNKVLDTYDDLVNRVEELENDNGYDDLANRVEALEGEKKDVVKERASEVEFLTWWYCNSDFGPSDSDVKDVMKDEFIAKRGKNIPEGFNLYSDGESSTDVEQL